MPDSYQRNVLVANRVARIFGILAFALFAILAISFGFNLNSPIIFGLSIFFLYIPYLNKKGFADLGRILLCIVPVLITMIAALLAKIYDPGFTDILYYDTRFFLILLSIIPCLIFNTSESVFLYGCLGFVLLNLILFDPIHEFFQVGYFQRGFTGQSYYYINYVAGITFIGIVGGAIILKRIIEKTERQNLSFKKDLIEKNKQLSELLQDVEAQNEEITAQSDELFASQEQLIAANKIIEKQKLDLQAQVIQVNSELEEANEELIKHNNELRQFSYTISHNLRGPVARLLGLTYLAHLEAEVRNNPQAMTIIDHIKAAAKELDHVIGDLNEIVDIRNTIYQIKQRIDFANEWKEISTLLQITDETASASFQVDFSAAPYIYSVKPMISSILFNLISNAIKYQSQERNLEVSLRTYGNGHHTVIEVSDNGLGIDLELFQDDIFKMYKRFHFHQEGKGLGLYMIKSQADSLNGFVEVFSKPDHGTIFKVHIKNSSH